MKIGVIDPGSRLHEVFKAAAAGHQIIFIPLEYIGNLHPTDYRVLVLPSYIHQPTMRRNRRRLEEFVANSNLLVILGATEQAESWLPFCSWISTIAQNVRIYPPTRVLGDLTAESLRVHLDFVGHGVLRAPDTADIIVFDDRSDNAVLFVFRAYGGILLVTTLDPDFHVLAPNKWPGEAEKSIKMMRAIFGWIITEAEKLEPTDRRHPGKRLMKTMKRHWRVLVRVILAVCLFVLAGLSILTTIDLSITVGGLSILIGILSLVLPLLNGHGDRGRQSWDQ